MLPIRFEDIGPVDILRLIENKISERKILEYKQALAIGGQEDRAEFLADVSSLANASGGDIVFGISELREGNEKTGIPDAITPLQIGNPATERARIEQIIESGIQPRIPVVQVKTIDIPERGLVIVVRIGKSWIAPHMVSYANRTRFYSRNGTGKVQLDVQQIGAAFAAQRGIGERLRAWKADRIAKALAGEGPVSMEGARLLFHFIPATALASEEQPYPRVFNFDAWGNGINPMSLNQSSWRYNADGLLLQSITTDRNSLSYLQVFRHGSLEYGDSYVLEENRNGAISGASLEDKIIKTFEKAIALLGLLDVPDPLFAALTLMGVKGRIMALPNNRRRLKYESEPFDRDVILCSDVLIQKASEGYPYASKLRPIVDSIWQAAGLGLTPYTDSNQNWVPRSL